MLDGATAESSKEQDGWITAMIESAMDAIIAIDSSQRIVVFNAAAEKMFGCTRETMIGEGLERLIPQRWRDAHHRDVDRFGQTGVSSRAMGRLGEIWGVRANGEEFPIEAAISQVDTPTGKRYTVVLRDMTERLRIEKALREANELLEVRVTERTRELQEANRSLQDEITMRRQMEEELVRSNAELEQFAYVTSHDLQEPLRMVRSYLQLLERRYKGKLDADADDFIAYAVDGVMRMHQLINDVLLYSRVRGRTELPVEPIDSAEVFDQAVANLTEAIRESDAAVSRDSLPRVRADRRQLAQLFQNLLGNAIKFRGEAKPVVHASARQEEGDWIFCVRDNGIGIAPEFQERIFRIFQRLHAVGKYPGTGIGLALCRKIVEQHGGRIWVESEAGKGAAFCFSLPQKHEVKS